MSKGFESSIKNHTDDRQPLMQTTFDADDELFSYYCKKEIINGFAQKPIRLENLVQFVLILYFMGL